MVRHLITLILLSLFSTLLNASDSSPFISVSTSVVKARIGIPEGKLDTVSDSRRHENGESTSLNDFSVDASTSTKVAIQLSVGDYFSDDVFYRGSLTAIPAIKFKGSGADIPNHIEIQTDIFMLEAGVGYEVHDWLYVLAGMSLYKIEANVSYWEAMDDGYVHQEHFKESDAGVSLLLEVGGEVYKNTYLTLGYRNPLGDTNSTGQTTAVLFGVAYRR